MRLRKGFVVLVFCSVFTTAGEQDISNIRKTLDDDESKYTNVGNIGVTVSNFGTIGHGWRYWPQQPSVEYPLGSSIEHMFIGGLWVGAVMDGTPAVSTAALDIPSVRDVAAGFEYTNAAGSRVVERSTNTDAPFFHPDAISHQDFIAAYTDSNTVVPGTSVSIPQHDRPLNISVHQESYAWNYPFADSFVILNFLIKNTGRNTLENVYVGHWSDMVVRNTNITPPRGSAFYQWVAQGYEDSLRLAYAFDFGGDPGFTDSYIAVVVLGVEKFEVFYTIGENGMGEQLVRQNFLEFMTNGLNHNYNAWRFRDTTDPNYFSPQDDLERYRKMQNGLPRRFIDPLRLSPGNMMTLISSGPVTELGPRQTVFDEDRDENLFRYEAINYVLGVVAAKKTGTEPASLDTEEQREQLYLNADWAQRAYNGEDRNGNGIQDEDEIWTGGTPGNPRPQRYILPSPPDPPRVRVEPGDREVTIYWDREAEESIDPITGVKDWEGYRIYRTNAGVDIDATADILSELILMAEFDKKGNEIGYNTGFNAVRLDQPVTFPDDPVEYHYSYRLSGLLNGWQYAFSVTAFDEGDPEIGLESLESSRRFNAVRVIPGTPATSQPDAEVGVYPNPYYGSARWDGTNPQTGDVRERQRKIYFYNLPSRATIRIYTIAGDLVKTLHHDSDSYAGEGEWFERFASDNVRLAGGEHAWDLITDFDQAIATGMYLFVVEDLDTGKVKRGRFLVVK
jgi:hypothetical protein